MTRSRFSTAWANESAIVLRVVASVKRASLVVDDKGSEIHIGPYNAIESAYRKLKSYGGVWNSSSKRLVIPVDKLTPIKRKNLDKLIKNLGKESEDRTDLAKKKYDVLKKTFSTLSHFDSDERGGFLRLKGPEFFDNVHEVVKEAGGFWDSSFRGYNFTPRNINPDKIDVMLKVIEKKDMEISEKLKKEKEVMEKNCKEAKRIIDGLGKNWNDIGASIYYKDDTISIVDLGKENRFIVKDTVPRPKYYASNYSWNWSCFANPDYLKKVISDVKKLKPTSEKKDVSKTHCRSNRKSGECCFCGFPVAVGDGCIAMVDSSITMPNMLRKWYSLAIESGDDGIWVVWHKDKSVCEKNKREFNRKIEENVSRNEIIKKIIAEIQKTGKRPSGLNRPTGKTFEIEKFNLYGGGRIFVIGNNVIWYVQNNGGDGDDWSLNNVETGGAGAIGWVAKRSSLIDSWLLALS